jgi:dTDP-4-amino-4,6-dideoxygalactose transaminase
VAALRAAGIEYGDEVVVPPYTFIATASACLLAGAVPVFADVDPQTFTLDPHRVEAAITPRTRAIIAVHIGGCPADMDQLRAIAQRHRLCLIEDAAQAHGAAWRGQRVGAIGDIGCFSFQSSKNVNAGEGGMVVTNDDALYARCWSYKNYGRIPEGAWYQHETLGDNFRITQFQAALLRTQLSRLDEWAAQRSANAAYLSEGLRTIGGLEPQKVDHRVSCHAYHLFIVRYNAAAFGGWSRERFLEALRAEGVPAARGYIPLYRTNAIRQGTMDLQRALYGTDAAAVYALPECPVTDQMCDEDGVWLVSQGALLGPRTDMDDILRAVEKLRRATSQM